MADAFDATWPWAKRVSSHADTCYLGCAGGRPQSAETAVVSRSCCITRPTAGPTAWSTGSVFGRWVEAARGDIGVPCLTSYEAMIEEAFALGDRFGILTTAAGTLRCLVDDIDRYSKAHGIRCSIVDHVEDAARPVILAGDIENHDRLRSEEPTSKLQSLM